MKTILKKSCINTKPRFTNGLERARAKKKRLYKAFIISQSSEAELKYKTYKNKLASVLRCSEKTYYSELLEKQKNNVMGIWKILNTIINKQFNAPEYPTYFVSNNKHISENKVIANGFNNYFTYVGFNLAKNIFHLTRKCL